MMPIYKACRNCKYSKTDRRLNVACHRYPPQIWPNPKGSSNGSYYETSPSSYFPKVSSGDTCGEWVGDTPLLRIKGVFGAK